VQRVETPTRIWGSSVHGEASVMAAVFPTGALGSVHEQAILDRTSMMRLYRQYWSDLSSGKYSSTKASG
jgi:hypothetical protein